MCHPTVYLYYFKRFKPGSLKSSSLSIWCNLLIFPEIFPHRSFLGSEESLTNERTPVSKTVVSRVPHSFFLQAHLRKHFSKKKWKTHLLSSPKRTLLPWWQPSMTSLAQEETRRGHVCSTNLFHRSVEWRTRPCLWPLKRWLGFPNGSPGRLCSSVEPVNAPVPFYRSWDISMNQLGR